VGEGWGEGWGEGFLKDILPTISPSDIKSTTDFDGLAALRNQAKSQSPEALKAVAQQFESLFLDMMMKSMRDANLGDGLFDSDESQFYQEMWDKQIAMQLAKGKGFGIADLMLRQLQQTGAAQPAAGEGPKSAADPAHFVRSVLPLARSAAEKLGTAPLALVAQAALETGWGTRIPRGADGSSSHNLFGIKSGSAWAGPQASARTVEYQQGLVTQKTDSFRAYGSPEEGFADYVQLLTANPRYESVLAAGPDVSRYAQALQDSGYASDPRYASKIKEIYAGETMRAALAQLKEGVPEPTP
jgi:flagellar protein FlgJ